LAARRRRRLRLLLRLRHRLLLLLLSRHQLRLQLRLLKHHTVNNSVYLRTIFIKRRGLFLRPLLFITAFHFPAVKINPSLSTTINHGGYPRIHMELVHCLDRKDIKL
jgi:hypothetical protein